MTAQTQTPASPAEHPIEVRPLSPDDLRSGAAFQRAVANLMKTCNDRLEARDRIIVIGSHVAPAEIREVVARFSEVGWSIKRSKKADDPNAIELRFREKRKVSAKAAPKTPKKKAQKKAASPAAPPA